MFDVLTMSNRTYICLDCRTAKRAIAAYWRKTDFRCPQCQKPLAELPWRRRIPKKDDDRGWKELERIVFQMQRDILPRLHAMGTVEVEKIDRKIASLKMQRDSTRQKQRLRFLRFRRRQIQKEYDVEPAAPANLRKAPVAEPRRSVQTTQCIFSTFTD